MTSVLAIGYGRQIFDEGNAERARLTACARTVDALRMIVFSKKEHGCAFAHDGNLFLHPTDSRTRIGMLFDAYRIGSQVLKAGKKEKEAWVISAQDPFEAGLVGYLLHLRYGMSLQVQEHGDFFGSTWWRNESLLNRARYVFGKWLMHRADCVRAVSKRVKEHLIAIGVDAARIAVLSVASDIAAFADTRPISRDHDLRLRYPNAETIIIAVGRMVKEKNFPLLIRAFKNNARERPKAQLVIIGSGPEEAALKTLVETYELSAQVSFVSWTSDVASYMRSADMFVLSSYREGWGRSIVESMSAGLPGVVTDVGCVGEVFIDGHHGVVVPVDDMAALAEALRDLISDPPKRSEYGQNAAQDAAAFVASQLPYAEAWLRTIEACIRKGL